MITVLQRVCWNSRSWKSPSGETFDSGNPGKIGFGNEEWNFCRFRRPRDKKRVLDHRGPRTF